MGFVRYNGPETVYVDLSDGMPCVARSNEWLPTVLIDDKLICNDGVEDLKDQLLALDDFKGGTRDWIAAIVAEYASNELSVAERAKYQATISAVLGVLDLERDFTSDSQFRCDDTQLEPHRLLDKLNGLGCRSEDVDVFNSVGG